MLQCLKSDINRAPSVEPPDRKTKPLQECARAVCASVFLNINDWEHVAPNILLLNYTGKKHSPVHI